MNCCQISWKYIYSLKISGLKNPGTVKFKKYIHLENAYGILVDLHKDTGHGGRDRMSELAKEKYANLTADMVLIFTDQCEPCVLKRNPNQAGYTSEPIITNNFNEHVPADLVDMQDQQCQEFRFFIVYQDHFTKLTQIRPLKRKTAKETTEKIFEFFCTFGAPDVLQNDNGREFKNNILEVLCIVMGIT